MEAPIKVLIVEDEYFVARMLQLNLQRGFSYQVSTPLATSQEALEYLAQERADIILMDVQLSGKMDGLKAAKTIIEQYDIPIIFITGYSPREIMDKFDATAPVMCLEKPMGPVEVDRAIKSLLARV